MKPYLFISSNRFFSDFLRIIYKQDHVIDNRDSFSSFPISIFFIYLFNLLSLARTSSTMLNKGSEKWLSFF